MKLISLFFVLFIILIASFFPFYTQSKTRNLLITTLSEVKLDNDVYVINGFYDYRIKSFRLFTFGSGNLSNYLCYYEYKGIKERCKYFYKPYRTYGTPYGHLVVPVVNKSLPKSIIMNKKRIKVSVPPERENQYNLAVCMCKMVNYTAVNRLIQTIESYRRFGADHFSIYLVSASERVMKVLEYYQSQKLIEIIKGNITMEYEKYMENMDYGILAKSDDCIYRNLKRSKRVAVVDLDEIIWPKMNNSIIEMLNTFKGYNGFSFRSFLFCTEIIIEDDHYNQNIVDTDIFSYRKYCRFKSGYVVKNIYANVTAINSVFLHWAVEYSAEYKEIDVPYDIAYIRHTRRLVKETSYSCETGWLYMKEDKREDEINSKTKAIRRMLNL